MNDELYLAYWNLFRYSYLLCNLVSGQHARLPKNELLELNPTDNVFLYVLKGGLRLVRPEKKDICPGMLLFVTPCLETHVQSTSDDTEFLLLHFDIYTHVGQEYEDVKEKLNDIHTNKADLHNSKTNIYLGRLADVSHDSTICLDFRRIQKELDHVSPTAGILIQNLITDIVLRLFSENLYLDMEGLLNHVDAVALSSQMQGVPLPQGREIWITDIDVWTENAPHQDPYLLGTLLTLQYYVDIPKSDVQLTYEHLEGVSHEHNGVGHICAKEKTPYHIWFWQRKGINALDLRTYVDTCYLTFYIKSNMVGSIGLSVFNTTIYQGMSYQVDIPVSDCWIPVKFYLCRHNERYFSPYVNKILSYIQAHYNQKIRTKDIAEYVHLHPSYISSLFRKQTGNSIGQYILNYRLMVAKNLLISTNRSVESIALDMGFYDLQHFSREFEKNVGMRPSVYRKVNQVENNTKEDA